MLARAGNGESFLVEKFFYAQHIFHIFVAIHALSGAAFHRFELGKLSFPETQDMLNKQIFAFAITAHHECVI